MTQSNCPSVSVSGLTCNKADSYDEHKTLTHRNNEQEREWSLTKIDHQRWETDGGKVVTKVTDDAGVKSEEAQNGGSSNESDCGGDGTGDLDHEWSSGESGRHSSTDAN